MSSEGWYYTREVGASGDDYTGLLCIPAGLLLIVLGVVTLWRSRRLDERRPRRYVRRALVGIAGVLVFASLVLPVVLSYGYTHIGRAVVPEPNLGAASPGRHARDERRPAARGLVCPVEEPRCRDRERRSQGHPAADAHARPPRLWRAAVRPARRGRQRRRSERFGWDGEKDLDAALAFLRNRPDVDPNRIGGIGLSVGGELLLQTAAHTDELKAVVSEGAGIRSVKESSSQTASRSGWASPSGRRPRPALRCSGTRARRRTSTTWSRRSPRAPCTSSTPSADRAERSSAPTSTRARAEPKFTLGDRQRPRRRPGSRAGRVRAAGDGLLRPLPARRDELKLLRAADAGPDYEAAIAGGAVS